MIGSISIPWVEGPMPSTDAARSEFERCGYTNISTFQRSEQAGFFVVVSGEKAT